MTPIIQVRGLTKVYATRQRSTKALDNLNLEIIQGEIFGYLGPNGAGKSTTIHLLLDLIRPTSGTAVLFGMDSTRDSVAIHRRIGFLPAELALWKGDTAREVARQIASIRGDVATQLREADQVAQRLTLDLSKKVRDFSTGNKRKLGLVLALMHRPDLLILDEPTSGLDPLLQQTFNQMMLEAKAEGRTVFLSSHVLSEVQAICGRVGILRDGQLKAVESVERLTHVGFRKVTLVTRDPITPDWELKLKHTAGISQIVRESDTTLKLNISGDFAPLLSAINGIYVKDMLVTEPTLEEIFLSFYGDTTPETRKAD
jgi:ABC-2 type transport system ATP-binding protein